MDFFQFDTPLGRVALAGEKEAITRLYLPDEPTPFLACRETPLLGWGREQLLEYLAGERRAFTLPLSPFGTPFQQRVWRALEEIPWGQTRSYREIALAVDCPRGFRAVGMANHRNPIPIFIPCHRVIGSDGSLAGYRGGAALKQTLLRLEGHKL